LWRLRGSTLDAAVFEYWAIPYFSYIFGNLVWL